MNGQALCCQAYKAGNTSAQASYEAKYVNTRLCSVLSALREVTENRTEYKGKGNLSYFGRSGKTLQRKGPSRWLLKVKKELIRMRD